jgi:hypothetical protein
VPYQQQGSPQHTPSAQQALATAPGPAAMAAEDERRATTAEILAISFISILQIRV